MATLLITLNPNKSLQLPDDPTKDTLSNLICSDCYTKCQSWLLFKTICNDNEHQFESVAVVQERDPVDLCPTDGSMEEIRLTIEEDEEDDEDEVMKDLTQDQSPTNSDEENFQFYVESTVCPVCHLLISDESKLNEHLKAHLSTEVKLYRNIDYRNVIYLFVSLFRTPNVRSVSRGSLCPLCEEVFTNRLSLSTHLKAEHLKERVRKDNTSL